MSRVDVRGMWENHSLLLDLLRSVHAANGQLTLVLEEIAYFGPMFSGIYDLC